MTCHVITELKREKGPCYGIRRKPTLEEEERGHLAARTQKGSVCFREWASSRERNIKLRGFSVGVDLV